MKQPSKMGLLFLIASISSVAAFPYNPLIVLKVIEPNNIKALWYVGLIFWIVGLILIIQSYYYVFLRKVKVLIDSEIYSIIRHPMYLGWILGIFVTTALLYQHWLFVIVGIPGIVSIYLISREEEYRSIERFGDAYKGYMQRVPRMNFILGIIRLWRRQKHK